jgi:hypothetical protein
MLDSIDISLTARRNRRAIPKSPLKTLFSKKAYNPEDVSTVATNDSLKKREFPTSPSEESKVSHLSKHSFNLGDLSFRETTMSQVIYSYRTSLNTSNSNNQNSICIKLPPF